MKILIVDDGDDKRAHVVQVLKEKLLHPGIVFEQAIDYEGALASLSQGFFDLVILDLLLPAAGQPPSEDSARALIRQLLQGSGLVPPTHVIGLTQFKEVGEKEAGFYLGNLLALEYYDRDNLEWADRIAKRIGYLVRSQRAAVTFQSQSFDIDVFILAARYENEYLPIKKSLFRVVDADTHPLWKGNLAIGEVKLGVRKAITVGLGCVGEMGMAPTAAVSSLAISVFRPRLLAMIGMCCGFAVDECAHPRKLLDVIVARQVACWEEGKYVVPDPKSDEFKNRSKPRLVDDAIRDQVGEIVEMASTSINPKLKRLGDSTSYKKLRTELGESITRAYPDVQYASIVSGSSVIADEAVVREIIARHPAAIGLDMELFGMYVAAERCLGQRPSVIGIKGIADFGRADKHDLAQQAASKVASEVFKCILSELNIFS